MSRNRNKNKMKRIVQDGEFTPVEDQSVQEAINEHQGEVVNLNDVAFMVMIGRYKTGEPFFTNVNVNDVFTIMGLLGYAESEMEAVLAEDRANKKALKGE